VSNLEKQTKISFLFLGLFILFSVLHNLTFGLTGLEEPVFFTLSLASFLAFALSLAYSSVTYARSGKPKDLWKLGFLGLLGIFGFFPRFGSGFFGLYGFFGFFGLKK